MLNNYDGSLSLFKDNLVIIRENFKWRDGAQQRGAALIYALMERSAPVSHITMAQDIVKNRQGAFSPFKGSAAFLLQSVFAANGEPEAAFSHTLEAYNLLKERKFSAQSYLPQAACLLAMKCEDFHELTAAADKTRELFAAMKDAHPMMASYDDYLQTALLGAGCLKGENNAHDTAKDVERIYGDIRREFSSNNSAYLLAQTITALGLSDRISEIMRIKDALKLERLSVSFQTGFTSLALLALIPGDSPAQTARRVASIYNDIKSIKGMGLFGAGKQELIIISTAFALAERVYVLLPAGNYGVTPFDIIYGQIASNVIVMAQAAATAAT